MADLLLDALILEDEMAQRLWAYRSDTGSADFPAATPKRVRIMINRIKDDAEKILSLEAQVASLETQISHLREGQANG